MTSPLVIVVAATPDEAAAVVDAVEAVGARAAVLVGDPADPAARAAVDELLTELA